MNYFNDEKQRRRLLHYLSERNSDRCCFKLLFHHIDHNVQQEFLMAVLIYLKLKYK